MTEFLLIRKDASSTRCHDHILEGINYYVVRELACERSGAHGSECYREVIYVAKWETHAPGFHGPFDSAFVYAYDRAHVVRFYEAAK